MKKLMQTLAVGGVFVFAAPVALAEDVTMQELPQPVRETVQREVGRGQLGDLERDQERGQTVYEVEFVDTNGQKIELDIAEDGTLLSRVPD